MRLLVFGQTGQVAQALARGLPAGITAEFLGRDRADLTDPAACAAAVAAARADAVINAAAWTAVDLAETAEPAATLVNAAAPAAMARACARRGLPFLHLSTDYVFDGQGGAPYAPDAPPAPLNAYGRSKLAGEAAVQASGAPALILRTSWVFSPHGGNFVRTMLRLGAERAVLRVVADQTGGPTPAAAIASALITAAQALADGQPGGIHHLSGGPDTTWADLARAVMAGAELSCRIEDIATADYPTPAPRPRDSRLDCVAFARDFGIARPDWRQALSDQLRAAGLSGKIAP